MLTKEKTDQKSFQFNTDLEQIANSYGKTFIAERLGFYLIEYACDCGDVLPIAFTLKRIRTSLLSYFSLPHTENTLLENSKANRAFHDDDCLVKTLHHIHSLLGHFIMEMTNEEESENDVTRKDIDFLLDINTAISKECIRHNKQF